MAATVTLRALRGLMLRGAPIKAGQRFEAEPLEAADCLGSGRAELVAEHDAAAVKVAVAAENLRVARGAPAPRGGPWLRVA